MRIFYDVSQFDGTFASSSFRSFRFLSLNECLRCFGLNRWWIDGGGALAKNIKESVGADRFASDGADPARSSGGPDATAATDNAAAAALTAG